MTDQVAPPEFDDAFAELAKLGDSPIPADFSAPKPVAEAAAEPAIEPVAPLPNVPEDKGSPVVAEPASDPAADASPAEPVVADASKPSPPSAPAPAPAKAEISDDDLARRLASLVRSQQPQPEQERQPQPAPSAAPAPLFTEDEQKFLTAYDKDWPEPSKATDLKLRAALQQAVGYIFQEVAKEFGPVVNSSRQLAERQQIMELRSHVPDYDKIYEPIVNWVGSQPPIIKSHLENIVKQGSADQVLSLIDTWRASQGQASAPAPTAPKAVPQLSPAVAKAAAALAPTSGKRSNVTRGEPEGFDDTWADIIKSA